MSSENDEWSRMDEELIPTQPIWVDSETELARLCDKWSAQAALAIDTEFMRSQTFYPKTGLLQIGDGEGCYLIDPIAIADFTPLKALLIKPGVTKVIHSCSEDLDVFSTLLGVVPQPLLDTQIAAAYAGYGFSVGYANLLKAVMGIEIPKSETRSDWLQRPLSQSQLKYAAMDVAYLLVVYGKLLKILRQNQRLSWVQEDCEELIANASAEETHDSYYRKVKLAWQLNRQELAVLQALCAWRERQARIEDIPRNRVMKERTLWELAKRKTVKEALLYKVDGLMARTIKVEGETLVNIIAEVVKRDRSTYPSRLPPPLTTEQGELVKRLKAVVNDKAQALGLPVEVLVRKKDYEYIVRSRREFGGYQLPERLQGWRRAVIGDDLIRVLGCPETE